ncbi:phosphatidate cytidylyltransferase [Sphingobium chlorophenolicum]|uniref:Phosphatidate cytidylyltransferase n=1 Tax=Sphingobium chlorophenolicum TaxID=46429 RepID=A0A081RJB4_SPHCR|nr:phosphatidate cytidylyltransferase [Sphingobium chlorophenolicum]KEQ55287.1 Phosphatidate cytidylyltransferase precursor [Sphingobium chlorophenolicum]
MSSELRTRAIVGILLILVALAALFFGGFLFWTLLSVAGVLMQGEWGDLTGANPENRKLAMFAVSVPLAILCPAAAGVSWLAFGLMAAAFFFVALTSRSVKLALGVPYIVVPVMALLFLRGQAPDTIGLLLTLWALALVWATDIGAYFAGRSIGGPKLAPRVSPSKTWSGLGGGVLAALLVGFLLYRFAGLPVQLAAASGLLAVAAQLGDLFESSMKRRAGVKDSGTLLPGHGGVMDRLDGVVAAAPLAAACYMFLVLP